MGRYLNSASCSKRTDIEEFPAGSAEHQAVRHNNHKAARTDAETGPTAAAQSFILHRGIKTPPCAKAGSIGYCSAPLVTMQRRQASRLLLHAFLVPVTTGRSCRYISAEFRLHRPGFLQRGFGYTVSRFRLRPAPVCTRSNSR